MDDFGAALRRAERSSRKMLWGAGRLGENGLFLLDINFVLIKRVGDAYFFACTDIVSHDKKGGHFLCIKESCTCQSKPRKGRK